MDHFIIPNVHPAVFPAVSGVAHVPELRALGIIESFSIAAIIEAAGAAVVERKGLLVEKVVIPRPRKEIVSQIV